MILSAWRRFIDAENAGAKLLGLAVVVAVVWVNSPLAPSYESLWRTELPDLLSLNGHVQDLRHVVNEVLMTVFFLVIGLEIKRELVSGELSSKRSASLPIVAAAGGMVLPAVIYLALNAGTSSVRGWGIPIATDIAFAVAVVSFLGTRVPSGLKVFLLALAIVDDIGAIVVIAVYYSQALNTLWLVIAGTITILLALVARREASHQGLFMAGGCALWVCAMYAGIHPTIAGVVIALIMPIGRAKDTRSLEDRLHPWSTFAIVPLFALANAGVVIDGGVFDSSITSSAGRGVILGLVVGKLAGIFLFSWVAVKTGLARLPRGVGWLQMLGAAAVAGIGFTVSIFITDLAFDDPALTETSKAAVFLGSLVAAGLGIGILWRATPKSAED
ncbi:MAG: Na+:H+ antiporter, NhaA family [Actinomycetota bacterium]|jgi:NhaA family Na+:H+ antiporter|nr:Na+:H+ antiporter, NhaA family [Actinomycetota bacterium]